MCKPRLPPPLLLRPAYHTIAALATSMPNFWLQDLARSAERVLARYDFLSAGMGALLVTGFCVARGQDVGTALWITAAATVGEWHETGKGCGQARTSYGRVLCSWGPCRICQGQGHW